MENPLLEEVPVEETKTAEEIAPGGAGRARASAEDPLKEIEVERFFEDYFDDGGRAADAAGRGARGPADREHPHRVAGPLRPPAVAAAHDRRRRATRSRSARRSSRTSTRTACCASPLEEVAAMGPWPLEEVERALALVQALDPPGVAARDLTECLRIQLRLLGLEGSPADVMVRDHMKQLQSHQYPEISRHMGLTAGRGVAPPRDHPRALDPRPGNRYSPNQSAYILPDVFVVKEGDEYKIVLNDDGLPKLRISPTYRRMLDHKEPGSRGDARLREGQAAQRALAPQERRPAPAHDLQGRGVDRAPPARRSSTTASRTCGPLVLRDVASDIGMHESTVSRVVANKYMHTPRGVYEMRFFFHSGITSTHGRGGQLGHDQGPDPQDDRRGGRLAARSPTRASPRSSGPRACPSPGAPSPSTGRSSASRPRTCARRSTERVPPAAPEEDG